MPWIPVRVKAGKDVDRIAYRPIDNAVWKFRNESTTPTAQYLWISERTLRYPAQSSFGRSTEFAPEAAALLFIHAIESSSSLAARR